MTYTFETIECEKSFGGSKIIFKEHRDIIKKYSEKGYKYIGFIPTVMDGYGHIKAMDLIFEKL